MSDTHTAIAATASRPEELHSLLALRFNQGDLDGVVGLYDRAATLVPAPGQQVSGATGLRQALAGFLAFKPRETFVETLSVVYAQPLDGGGHGGAIGEQALTRSRWGLKGTHPESGAEVVLEHRGVEVMRRQPDGSWRFLIDDPFGGDLR